MTEEESKAYLDAYRRIEACAKSGDLSLDLSSANLNELPPNISSLTDLTELNLADNDISFLPNHIGKLSSLRELNLKNNHLRFLPPEIGMLSFLRNINLNGNQLNALTPELGKLNNLTELHLSGNQLHSLPSEIGYLSNLILLDLTHNQLVSLPPEIGMLSNLAKLYLGGNKLSSITRNVCTLFNLTELIAFDNKLISIPHEIANLGKLKSLDLFSNQLRSLPPEIGMLSELAGLNLYQNELTALPNEIGMLTKLTRLYLNSNRLTSLPKQIGKLHSLVGLDLRNNLLSSLPPEIGMLKNLSVLRLSDNQLRYLPAEIENLAGLSALFLHSNTELDIPDDVLGPTSDDVHYLKSPPASPRALFNYYFARQRGSKPLNEVKIILVGRGEVGKTSLRKRLIDNRFDPEQKETAGIEIEHYKLERSADGIEGHMWDFAGQEITQATHQFFLTKRSLYLLVLDGRSDSQDSDAEKWLRMIRAFGEDSPVIVILNKWDQKPFGLSSEFSLRRDFPQIRTILRTDCKTGLGISELEQTILQIARSMPSVTQDFPSLWFDVKERLASMEENFLPLCDYRRVCEQHGVTEPGQQDSLAETLHHLGIILHYANDPRLHDTTVLNPRWVTDRIYGLIRYTERRQVGSGRYDGLITLAEARQALPEETLIHDREGKAIDPVAYLIGLMERFELCYALEGREETWLIPQQLSSQSPKELGSKWFTETATRLRYQYALLQSGLLPRFIVRAHPLVFDAQVWRQGVVLEMQDPESSGTAYALLLAEPNRDRIEVNVSGPQNARLRLTKLIRAHFQDIHFKSGIHDVMEFMELEELPGVYQSIKTLVADEKKKQITTAATEEGSVTIQQTDELNRVASPEGKERQNAARAIFSDRPKVFLSYAHKDAAYRDVFLQNLEVLEMDGLIDSWFDGKILASQDFDKEIRHNMKEADIIIFLISTAALRSKYIREVEISYAVQPSIVTNSEELNSDGLPAKIQVSETPPTVIPILLEKDCAWKDGALAKLQTLPLDHNGNVRAVDQWQNRRQAFNAVEQALRRLLKTEVRR